MKSSNRPSTFFVARPQTGDDGTLVEDLFCLDCGYNLRGLPGDPIRCPECGTLNDLGEAAIPAWAIGRAIRRMEDAPTRCVFWAFLAVLCVGIAAYLHEQHGIANFFTAAGLSSGAVWPFMVARTRIVYFSRPGWARVLFGFHLATALCSMWWPLLIVLVSAKATAPSYALAAAATAAASFVAGLRVYRNARKRIALMQRDEAVRIAREEPWNRLRHEHR